MMCCQHRQKTSLYFVKKNFQITVNRPALESHSMHHYSSRVFFRTFVYGSEQPERQRTPRTQKNMRASRWCCSTYTEPDDDPMDIDDMVSPVSPASTASTVSAQTDLNTVIAEAKTWCALPRPRLVVVANQPTVVNVAVPCVQRI